MVINPNAPVLPSWSIKSVIGAVLVGLSLLPMIAVVFYFALAKRMESGRGNGDGNVSVSSACHRRHDPRLDGLARHPRSSRPAPRLTICGVCSARLAAAGSSLNRANQFGLVVPGGRRGPILSLLILMVPLAR